MSKANPNTQIEAEVVKLIKVVRKVFLEGPRFLVECGFVVVDSFAQLCRCGLLLVSFDPCWICLLSSRNSSLYQVDCNKFGVKLNHDKRCVVCPPTPQQCNSFYT